MPETMSPKALNDLGDSYFYGIGRPMNREMAYTFYKQAADLNNPVGLFNVGMCFTVKNDFPKAVEYLEKARACGHSPALLLLGTMHREGKGFHKSKKKAFKMFLEAAKLGDIDGFNAVGECYLKGFGVGKNPAKSQEIYQKSADQGNPVGELHVGLFLKEAPSYAKSPEQAIFWFDKASSHGSVEAMKELVVIYREHTHPYFRKKSVASLQEMMFFYQEALAKANDPECLKIVADAYFNGTATTKKNNEKAASYYRTLAELQNDDGKYGYAVMLLYGLGISKDIAKAKKLLEECAKNSHPSALTRLGDIFRQGLGVPADNEEAKKWYMEGAKVNDPEALMNLGLLNYRQQVLNATPDLAFNFMETAAKKGYFQALYWLGIFHDKGVGCPASFREAEKCFEKAIQNGSLGAKYKYASMILDEITLEKDGKKVVSLFRIAKKLLIEYINDPLHNIANTAFAMEYLGKIHRDGLGTPADPRISRYWYESAAETGLPQAMVEMFRILKTSEFDRGFDWLKKAAQDLTCGEAFYELGLLYLSGVPGRMKTDIRLAKTHFETAAKLNYKPAVEKLMMM